MKLNSRLFRSCFILVILIQCLHAHGQIHAMDAYEIAQGARQRAGDFYGKRDASPQDIATGIRILDSSLHFLDSLPISELEYGNSYLKYRKHDVCMDMAKAYSVAGNKDSALYFLGQMFDIGSFGGVAEWLQSDSLLMGIWSDPSFIALIDKLKLQGKFWKGAAFKTAFRNDLPYEEKVAGLSLLWSQAKYNFVYFDHLKTDWDETYLSYLPKLKDTRNTTEYYRVLQRFYAELKDGHCNVYPPDSLAKEFYSRPPLSTALIEGRVFVTAVRSDSLLKTGIVPGLEILRIDGQPVLSYAEQQVAPYQSSSTPQDLTVRKFTYFLLAGPASAPIALTCKDKSGKTWTKAVARTGYTDIIRSRPLEFSKIGNIGYLVLNSFEDRTMVHQFDSLFAEIAATKALIIDIRNNGGGDDGIGSQILGALIDKPFQTSRTKLRKYVSSPDREIEWDQPGQGTCYPRKDKFYAKPVVLLIGPGTFSAAEDFAMAFDYIQRGTMIGQKTGGSTGQPISFGLPGGGTARICAKRETYPDGKEFVGVGISPTITVEPAILDLMNDLDAARQRAIDLLNGKLPAAALHP